MSFEVLVFTVIIFVLKKFILFEDFIYSGNPFDICISGESKRLIYESTEWLFFKGELYLKF